MRFLTFTVVVILISNLKAETSDIKEDVYEIVPRSEPEIRKLYYIVEADDCKHFPEQHQPIIIKKLADFPTTFDSTTEQHDTISSETLEPLSSSSFGTLFLTQSSSDIVSTTSFQDTSTSSYQESSQMVSTDTTSETSTESPSSEFESSLSQTEVSWDSSSSEMISSSSTEPSPEELTFQDTSFASTTEVNEIVELTSKYHQMRVTLANYSSMIHSKQKLITQLTETVNDLRNEISELKLTHKNEVDRIAMENDKCLIDLSHVESKFKVVQKLIAMEKYGEGLRSKLSEFQFIEDSKNTSQSSIKFSIFEIESDEFSGKILSNRQLYMLPPEIGLIVSNVSELSATNVGLVVINQNAFEGLSELKVLNLSENKVSLIESGNFRTLESLKCLDLSKNLIETIESNAFDGLNELEELFLNNNKIKKLPSFAFESLLDLKILDLSFNQITELEKMFTTINVIEEFYANNNLIKIVDSLIISDFERSRIIDLSVNVCIDQRFPENLTMVQMAIEVSENCKG